MKLKEGLIVLLVTLLMSSCVSVGASQNNCSWVKPILIEKEDRLTPTTARTILTHNETWEEVCTK
mgnify:CR=1 FL=1|jgi:hypothetical protein